MATKFHYILTTRFLGNPASRHAVKPLIKDMYSHIQKYPGFIYGKSFWGNNGTHMYTITKWRTLDNWKLWHNSKERQDVLERHHHEAIKITEDIIDKYDDAEVVFGNARDLGESTPKDIETLPKDPKEIELQYTEKFGL